MTLYERNDEVRVWLRSFKALPLAKHGSVDAVIGFLIDNASSSDSLLATFCQYFKNQWVLTIPAKYWNLEPTHLRRNNAVEGIHMLVLISHSNVNASVDVLLKPFFMLLFQRSTTVCSTDLVCILAYGHSYIFFQQEESLVLMLNSAN